ncbi:involucrin-like [Oryzias latipes]|uniref:involucrin-like n=1 Tax=Oryzias latipes TaxID=8090 RepID=UPI000CE27FA7|nr:involucrin-like [Oryzias latipes]
MFHNNVFKGLGATSSSTESLWDSDSQMPDHSRKQEQGFKGFTQRAKQSVWKWFKRGNKTPRDQITWEDLYKDKQQELDYLVEQNNSLRTALQNLQMLLKEAEKLRNDSISANLTDRALNFTYLTREAEGVQEDQPGFQAESQHQHDQTSILDLELQNEEMVQELEKLQDKLLVLSDRKAKYEPAGDHLKAAQDQNSVLKEKLLQLQSKIQQEEALLMMTPDISPEDLQEEYRDQIQALEQENAVLQKDLEDLKKKRSKEAAMRIDLICIEAQKSHLEDQCQHIREVIQIHSEQQDGELVYPEQIQELKCQINSLEKEKEDLLEEQRKVENAESDIKMLLKEFHQVVKNVDELKKKNCHLKWEFMELNVDFFERQRIPAKLEASTKEQESLRKENAVLAEQVSECRSKIHQQKSVQNQPQSPARNRPSLIPRPMSVRNPEHKQVSMDTGRTQQPQSPARNRPSLRPKPVSVRNPEPKQVSMDTGRTQQPQSPARNQPSLRPRPVSVKRSELPKKVSKVPKKTQPKKQQSLRELERGWRT